MKTEYKTAIQQRDGCRHWRTLSKERSKRFKVEYATLELEQDKAKPENIRFTIHIRLVQTETEGVLKYVRH